MCAEASCEWDGGCGMCIWTVDRNCERILSIGENGRKRVVGGRTVKKAKDATGREKRGSRSGGAVCFYQVLIGIFFIFFYLSCSY